jgi:hypothetical protein
MSTSAQIRKSPKLVLYGIAFRVLGELAVQAGEGAARPAPHPSRQGEQRPLQPHLSVRPDADR